AVEVELRDGDAVGREIAPAGASTGTHEARERRDADGRGVAEACAAFAREVTPAVIGRDCRGQEAIDAMLVELDGSAQHARLGGNTAIATSLAVLQTAAAAAREPLWRHLAG